MGHSHLSLLVGFCILATISQNETTTVIPGYTDGCCLGEVTRNDVMYIIDHPNVTSESECRKQCNTTVTCVGINWTSNSGYHDNECKLLTVTAVNKVTLPILVNCAGDNITYCWKVKSGVHQDGGKVDSKIKNEAVCKGICVSNKTCTGVVWNIKRGQCWILLETTSPRTLNETVNYWTIVRDLPRTFQNTNLSSQFGCDETPVRGESSYSTESSSDSTELSSDSTESSAITSREQQKFTSTAMDTLHIALAASMGVMALTIVGISVYAVRLKNCCSAQKKVDKAKVNDFAKVYDNMVKELNDNMVKELNDNMVKDLKANVVELEEAKEDDVESYVDYQDLRRVDDAKTYEDACEYTAMELENMKDDDNVYYNEDQ